MVIELTLQKLLDKKELSYKEVVATFDEIVKGKCSDILIGAWLVALRAKGETATEIAACIDVMRREVFSIWTNEDTIDIVGTGGDGVGTYNISTAAAIVASACGVQVAKHGNRALSSKSGSADVLSSLGVKLDLSVPQVQECLQEVGICFLFAPCFHPSMKYVLPARRELKIRTVFNLLGPMTNPAGVKRGVIGVYNKHYCKLLAQASCQLDAKHMLFVYGDGLDELSVSGVNTVFEVCNGKMKQYELKSTDVNLGHYPISQLVGATPSENAKALQGVLAGKPSAYSDAVAFNAGAGIYTAGLATDIKEGVQMALNALSSGKGAKKLEELQTFMKNI